MAAAHIRKLVADGASDNEILAYAHGTFGVRTPLHQKPAPEFSGTAVINKEFKEISLSDYRGKWVVLFFYPLDFTFVCPTEIIAFSDRIADFEAINAQPIAASCDSHFSHLAWVNTPRNEGGLGDMRIPILADFTKQIASDYGVLIREGGDTGVPLRGLFIIDPEGILRQSTINDLPVGRSVDETLRLIKAFQFVAKHGEVCPANWQPGDLTINTAKSSEYFQKAPASQAPAGAADAVKAITDKAEFDALVASGKTVIVDYWAPWCRNCKKIAPVYERLAAELGDKATFVKVDTTQLEDLAAEQGVEALPTLHVFKSGVKGATHTGSDASALESFLRSSTA